MTKILHIVASPQGEKSASRALATAYISAQLDADNSIEVDTISLWDEALPEFDGDKTAAKLTFFGHGEMTPHLQTAWDQVVAVFDRFNEADIIVFSIPMWNGGMPYKLKHYIDLITQPGLYFNLDPQAGYVGLLKNKRARIFLASAVYAPGVPSALGEDFLSTHMESWLKMGGVSDIKTVGFQGAALSDDPQKAMEVAIGAAAKLDASR